MVALERPLKLGDVVSDTLMFSFWSFFTMLGEDLLGQHFLDHYFFLICLFIQNLASSKTLPILPLEVFTNFFLIFQVSVKAACEMIAANVRHVPTNPVLGGVARKRRRASPVSAG